MKTNHHIPGCARIAGRIVIGCLVWTIASCGMHPHEPASMAPSPETKAATGYFGDEYAREQRALQEKSIEPSVPTF